VFPDVLDREVKTAGAVVSLWSPHALSRPWVKQECSIGLKRKCLIPLMIEPLGDLDVPVAFEGLQQIDFTGFHGRTDTPEWRSLMRALARTLKRPDLVAALAGGRAAERNRPPQPRPRPNRWLIAFSILGAGVIAAIASLEFQSPDRTVLPEEPAAILDGEASTAEAPVSDPAFNPDTDETGGIVVPIPWWTADVSNASCASVTATVYFEFDKTVPNPASVPVLEEVLTRAFGCMLYAVQIEAHDDLVNSPAYAQGLSERRAQDLAALLAAKGVDAAIITTAAFGATRPLETGKRTPMNRRAVIRFVLAYPPAAPAAVFPPPE
jgi:outer membrane protein OmpA-like peptidoglycan-associated protein